MQRFSVHNERGQVRCQAVPPGWEGRAARQCYRRRETSITLSENGMTKRQSARRPQRGSDRGCGVSARRAVNHQPILEVRYRHRNADEHG